MSLAISKNLGIGLLLLGMDLMIPSKNPTSIETDICLTCYRGDYYESGQVIVYEGDSLTTDFKLDIDTGEWTDSWMLVPGAMGRAAGEESGSGVISKSFRESSYVTLTPVKIF